MSGRPLTMADPKTKIIIAAEDRASGVFDGLRTKATGVAAAVAGAFAADQLIDFAQALAPIADAAANLEARLQLAVGANGDLGGALEAVRASANAAGADINSVGELYGRIASSTADLGFSQERVAGLTDTINKSFVVSGTSASAASGAITQLAQAFASGALRGDEFNSVNEAAPRLMDALAAGLGVARGELRKMAEQGQLTTEVVLGALESQRDAIERDFVQLPDTIGRATQRLANEWQVFVGRLNETTGASDAVAGGLNLIADNLDNIAGVAATAGEIIVSALAVKAAAALRGYITLTAASTAATTAKAAALTGLAAAGKAATAAMLTLGRALPGLAVAGAVAGVAFLVAKFFEAKGAAEDAEEAVAKLLAEPPPNATADQIRLIATEAEAARFKLSEVERTFGSMRQKGQDAATALGNIAKAANIDSADGIGKLITDLDVLRQGAQVTGQQIQTALADRLKKLSNEDLQAFGIQAEMAFNRGAISAQQLGVALDAQARAALVRLGVDADVTLTGMSAKFTEAVGSVEVLAGQYDQLTTAGINAGAALDAALAAALARAKNPVEFENLKALVIKLGKEGALAGAEVSAALEEIRRKAGDAAGEVTGINKAFRELRITSDAELRAAADRARAAFEQIRDSGTASAREVALAFDAYAKRVIEANNGVVSEALKAEAALYDLGAAGQGAGTQIESGMSDAADAVRGVGSEADRSAERIRRLQQLQQQGGGGGGGGRPGGTRDQEDDNVYLAENGAMYAEIGNGGTEALFKKWASEKKGPTGPAESPVLGILNRAEQLGGLEMRKQFEEEFQRRAKRQGMRVASFGTADYNRFWQSVSDQLDAIQIEQERASGRYESNQPRIVGQQPREQITTYRVQIGTGAGRTQTINTASRADAEALTELLRQLEADMSRA